MIGAVARANPLLASARRDWAYALNGLSNVQTDNGHYAEAAQSALTAIDMVVELGRDYPSSPGNRFDLGCELLVPR